MALNLINLDKATMLKAVGDDFTRLSKDMFTHIGISLTVVESYKYEWEIVEELKSRIKNPEVRESLTQLSYATESLVTNLATSKTSLLDLVKTPTQEAVNTYEQLKGFISSLPAIEFEPPLGEDYTSLRSTSEVVYSIPNYPDTDPRRSGRIIKIGPKASIHATTLKYLIQNAGKYGFVFYGPKDPSIWYWRGDKLPTQDPTSGVVREYFTPYETAATFSNELIKLLPPSMIPQVIPQQQAVSIGPAIVTQQPTQQALFQGTQQYVGTMQSNTVG